MQLEIVNEKQNPLLERKEVVVKLQAEEATPSRKHVLELLSKQFGNSPALIFIDKIAHPFGRKTALVRARLYDSEKAAKQELSYVQERGSGKKKPGEAKEEKKPKAAEKKEEKAAEKKEEKGEEIAGEKKEENPAV